MPPKKKKLTFVEALRKIKKAGIENTKSLDDTLLSIDEIESLDERVQKILGLFNRFSNDPKKMIFFVMYDIENNKIRNYIAKYLQKKGCVRVQKSIFLAEIDRKLYMEIYDTLKEVQEVYDNNDSIFLVPVSGDEVRSTKIIGHTTDFSFISDKKSTLFF